MSEKSLRENTIRYWYDEALNSLQSARREADAGSYKYAVNRLYYAVFYCVTAALYRRGLEFKKHSGVRSAFHTEFIANGTIDRKYGKLYDRLFEDRHEGDYVVFVEFDSGYTENLYSQCREFVELMKEFITSLK